MAKEYQQAKDVINTLDTNDSVYINVSHLPNFRKYLKELCKGDNFGKQFATRYVNSAIKNQLQVNRIK